MPNDVHVIVEIPRGSRNKYEWDEQLNAIKLDRFLFSSVVYPTDYGFIPETLGEDGDPLDAMVCVSEPTFPGCVIAVKVIALFRMSDEEGVDDKVLCVPHTDPNWNTMETLEDIPRALRDEISHFFSIYKQPQGIEVSVDGWYQRRDALDTIDAARERHRAGPPAAGLRRGGGGGHVTDAVRTPDELFAGLPGIEALGEPAFRQWEGLRLAHHDVGDGPPVVFFHGEPTWAYLWRKVIPPVREAGFRCVAPDLPGFGRSDKPVEMAWYSYERHVAAMADLFEELDLRDATVVVHDWGGPIGLRIAVEHADRVARMVILDSGLFTGRQRMSEAWQTFRAFVERTEDLPIGMLVRRGCHTDPGDEVVAAYDAPYVNADAKAGARAFPLMLPLSPQDPGADAGQRVLEALAADERPTLMLWGADDPILTPATGERFARAIGREAPEPIAAAGHFLQEDQGELIGRRIAEWLTTE